MSETPAKNTRLTIIDEEGQLRIKGRNETDHNTILTRILLPIARSLHVNQLRASGLQVAGHSTTDPDNHWKPTTGPPVTFRWSNLPAPLPSLPARNPIFNKLQNAQSYTVNSCFYRS